MNRQQADWVFVTVWLVATLAVFAVLGCCVLMFIAGDQMAALSPVNW